ncbi:FAD-binding oxidoreductase [Leptospira sp. SA-E8]|uniref:FAD-binding oxidoreductase n=1 Tax=Leptospira sp. SA-E8 TaxID=3422259 RepID=UPI003EC05C2D
MEEIRTEIDDLSEPIEQWKKILGKDHLLTEGEELDLSNSSAYGFTQDYRIILKPKDPFELSECLKIANYFRIKVHSISKGKNWGYGSKSFSPDMKVLISLERMDRILHYDETLAYVILEPGVTFRKLAAFLSENGGKLQAPIPGTSPDASVLGNATERGIGKGVYTQFANHCKIQEIVTSSGEILSVGFKSQSSYLICEDTTGPSISHLFFQSNLGVVTKIALLLEPGKEIEKRIFFFSQEEKIGFCSEVFREYLQRGRNRITLEILNDYRFATQKGNFPFDSSYPSEFLPRKELSKFFPEFPSARWFGSVNILENPAFDQNGLFDKIQNELSVLPGIELIGNESREYPSGFSDHQLNPAYWRKKFPPPKDPDPDRDGCGILWLSPIIPHIGSILDQAVQTTEEILFSFKFEPLISMRPGFRTVKILIGIVYDREVKDSNRRALECYKKLKYSLSSLGFHFYRSGVQDREEQTADPFVSMLKKTMDPNGILSPQKSGII